jgi:hypothetical protein
MKSQSVASTGNSYTNPLYRPPGAGDVKKGPPPETQNGVNDFDFGSDFDGGEPQPVSKEGNLSITSADDHQDDSVIATSKTVISLGDSPLDNSHNKELEANSASENGVDDEPTPTPPPAKTATGPAQPSVQLSDDPAIAALQKSTLNATTQVVLYTTCLNVLTSAIADHKLPPNSFSYLTSLFSNLIKDSETRTRELADQTEQLLKQHSEEAKTLAAQAESGAFPAPVDTFSAGPSSAVTHVDLKQALHEVKQLPPTEQDLIVVGLRTACQDTGRVTHEEQDQLMLDMGGDTNGTRQQADDVAELDQAFEKLVNVYEALEEDAMDLDKYSIQPTDADIEAVEKAVRAEENEKFVADLVELGEERNAKVDDLLRQFNENLEKESSSADHDGSLGGQSMNAQRADLAELVDPYSDQDALLAEVEALLQQKKEAQATLSKITSPQNPLVTHSELKPPALSNDVRRGIEGEAFRYRAHTLDLLNAEIELIKKRQLTSKELKSPSLAAQETKNKTQAIIARYHQEQQHIVALASQELDAIKANEVMPDELPSARLKRQTEVEEKRKTAMDLLDTMGEMIHKLWS